MASRTNAKLDAVLICEVAAVLAEHGRLRCVPSVEIDDGALTVTLVVKPTEPGDEFEALELYQRLCYVRDICQLRSLAYRYDIDPAALEALLPRE